MRLFKFAVLLVIVCMNDQFSLAQNASTAGVYTTNIGDVRVTALLDSTLQLGPKNLEGDSVQDAARKFLSSFNIGNDKLPVSVAAYLLEIRQKRILIDTGYGSYSENAGQLLERLEAAGISPDQIDIIVLTHMHPDHAYGLIDADGAAVFRNARLIVHRREWAFWHSNDVMNAMSAEYHQYFTGARKAVSPYATRVQLVEGEHEVLPGIQTRELFGHTDGHMGVMVQSGSKELLIWGDLLHIPELQLPHPEWAIEYDHDKNLARTTRQETLKSIADTDIIVAGMHLPFPGIGRIMQDEQGYRFIALD